MIGQMQGKFQMDVITGVGHMLHEVRNGFFLPSSSDNVERDFSDSQDEPTRLAEILVEFWRRNERILPAGIKKVGDL